jgi:hypothetical protein
LPIPPLHRGERFLAGGAGPSLDLDQARREAADQVVVSKVRVTLEYLRLHPG